MVSFRSFFFLAVFGLSLAVFASPVAYGQEEEPTYNPLSLYPVSYDRIQFKKTVWRRLDLNEKQNQPFFARGREISKIIIEAVKDGYLTPYANDSVQTPMSMKDFMENMKIPEEGGGLSEEERALGFSEDELGGDWGGDDLQQQDVVDEVLEYASRDFSIAEIKEDYFFDQIRSQMRHDIHALTLILPADKNPAAFEKPLASFRFIDLARLFRSMPKEAIWFNRQNPARHLNLTDAFLLRLFNGMITKIANPNDDAIVDIYASSRRAAAIASQQADQRLVDLENELWEH